MYTLVTLTAIILLPLAPAYLLFKALPSTAVVSGPLQGLKLNIGGAFGGYFAMVVLVLSTHSVWNQPPPLQQWAVRGQITDDHGVPIQPFAEDDIALTPPSITPLENGTFELIFWTTPGEYPVLNISHTNFTPVTINLDPSQIDPRVRSFVSWDQKNRVITINSLPLQALPAYQPPSATLTAVSNPPAGPTQ